ncbi:hypothetical protein GCM10027174_34850 [Salinifilum aidingensis]
MPHTRSHAPQRIRGALGALGLLLSTLLPLTAAPPAGFQPAGAGTAAASAAPPAASPAAPHRTSTERRGTTFGWPLRPPRPVRPFDPPATEYGPGHRGLDLAGTASQPVLAAADGRVSFAGPVAEHGVVSLEHPGGLRTTYQPVVPEVAAGDAVARGDRIGRLAPGHPGCPPAAAAGDPRPEGERACLHWGARRGDTYIDPVRLVHRVEIRLLPWDAGRD